MAQPSPAVAGLLLLTVAFDHSGMITAVALPVIAMASAPLAWAVAADLAILGIGGNLLSVILGATFSLTGRIAADHLAWLILRWLEKLLTVAATPFIHNRRCLTQPAARRKPRESRAYSHRNRGPAAPFSFRVCCRVPTASPPMVNYKTGGNA